MKEQEALEEISKLVEQALEPYPLRGAWRTVLLIRAVLEQVRGTPSRGGGA